MTGVLTDGRAVVPCTGSQVDHCRAVPTTGSFGKHSYRVRLLNVSMVIVDSRKIRALAGPNGVVCHSAHQALLCEVCRLPPLCNLGLPSSRYCTAYVRIWLTTFCFSWSRRVAKKLQVGALRLLQIWPYTLAIGDVSETNMLIRC